MRTATLVIPLLVGVLGVTTSPAAAQDLTLQQATERLHSSDPSVLLGAIQSLGMLGNPRAIEPLAARIRDGLPPDALESAIDTLTVLGRPEAGPVLYELTSHRRPEVRLRAVQAIAATRPRGADRALVSALSDSNAEVRGAAATALGELGTADAVESLFLAFDRGVPEAGPALGRLARPEHVTRLLALVGRVSFTQIRAVLGEVLARRDLPVRTRLDVISRLGELATPEARSFLDEWVQMLPDSTPANDPVRRAAQDVITRIAA